MTVEQIVTEPLLASPDDIPRKQWKTRELELVDLVGLSPHHAARYPHQFSSGQLQRISTARALICQPKLLICNEAISALDVSFQAQIVDFCPISDAKRHGAGYDIIPAPEALRRGIGVAYVPGTNKNRRRARDRRDMIVGAAKKKPRRGGAIRRHFLQIDNNRDSAG